MRSLEELLQTLPDVYATLGDALHGTRGGGDGERVTGGGDTRPLPLQTQVADHRHVILTGMRGWVARCTNATPRVLVSTNVARMAAWLLHDAGDLDDQQRHHLHMDLADWHRKAHALTDLPRIRATIPLGHCPNTTELWTCTGQLRAIIPADHGQALYLTCRDCGGRWDITELPDAGNVPVPLAHASELLHIPLGTLKGWVHYGNLEPVAREPIRVLLRDCLTVAAQ